MKKTTAAQWATYKVWADRALEEIADAMGASLPVIGADEVWHRKPRPTLDAKRDILAFVRLMKNGETTDEMCAEMERRYPDGLSTLGVPWPKYLIRALTDGCEPESKRMWLQQNKRFVA